MHASKIFRVSALCIAVAACSFGPLGETIGCACAEQYFAYADIKRWEAGTAQGSVRDMAALQEYYRAKGWHERANDLFKRRILAGDSAAIAEQRHVQELMRESERNDVDAIDELSAYYTDVGEMAEVKRLHTRLVALRDPCALDNEAFDLFHEAINLPDQKPEKLKKLRMARTYYERSVRQVSYMDAATLRGSGLSYLLKSGERGAGMQTLVEREIERLEH